MKIVSLLIFSLFLIACSSYTQQEVRVESKSPDSVELVEKEGPGIEFKLANVELAKSLLPDTNYNLAVEARVNKKVFVSSAETGERLTPIYNNGFLQTVHSAYAEHRPLVISPDAVWLLIEQGFSIHINQHYKKYENVVLKKNRPKEIRVREDSLVNGNPKYWTAAIDAMAGDVENYVHDSIAKIFVPQFSTSTKKEITAFQITLLETFKKSFDYAMESGCGIPSIKLRGNRSDWKKIDSLLEKVKQYDLQVWGSNLQQVIGEFINVYDGKINAEFWNTIYKDYSEYNVQYVSGWVLKFFPYVKSLEHVEKDGGYYKTYNYVPNQFIDGEDYRLSVLTTEDFPEGIAEVDFVWDNYGKKMKMKMYSGFVGIRQNDSTKAIETEIGWAVCEADSKVEELYLSYGAYERMDHKEDLWISDTSYAVVRKPIYHPEKNKNYDDGIKELKDELQVLNLASVQINFFVTWGGTVTRIEVLGKVNDLQKQKIKKTLLNLKYDWKPAQSKGTDEMLHAMKNFNFPKSNYLVKLSL